MASFEGLEASDFDAFDESKWSSHAFNRERLEVKLKLSTLGKAIIAGLEAMLPAQEMGVTEERPSIFNQHKVRNLTLYFFRDEAARRELGGILDKARSIADNVMDPAYHHRHINLGLRLHHQGVDAGLWIHQNAWVDWKNLTRRCSEYWERDKLSELLASLPGDVIYVRGESMIANGRPAGEIAADEILGDFDRDGPWTFLGESWKRTESVLASSQLSGRVLGLFASLVPVHEFIGWRRTNDYHDLKEVIRERKEKVKVGFTDLKRGDRVRVLKGLATGQVGTVEGFERKGKVKIRLGTMVVAVKVEELGKP